MTPPRLLVIDDEPAVGEVLSECLSLLGYDVEATRDEADGLARLTRERFDLRRDRSSHAAPERMEIPARC